MEMYGLIVHTFLVCSYILRQEIKYVFTVVMAACLTCRSYRELIFQYLSLPFKSLALKDFIIFLRELMYSPRLEINNTIL